MGEVYERNKAKVSSVFLKAKKEKVNKFTIFCFPFSYIECHGTGKIHFHCWTVISHCWPYDYYNTHGLYYSARAHILSLQKSNRKKCRPSFVVRLKCRTVTILFETTRTSLIGCKSRFDICVDKASRKILMLFWKFCARIAFCNLRNCC